MVTQIKNATVITNGKSEKRDIFYKDGKIVSPCKADNVIDGRALYASPGFIELHVHGGDGYEFIDATKDAVVRACNVHAKRGTTTIYPTLSAYKRDDTERALKAIEKYKSDVLCNIAGVHLEGPYFSTAQAGAQDPRFIRDPDPEEYKEMVAQFPSIKRWSYAPERKGSAEFQRFLTQNGVVGAMAHTDAKYDEIMPSYNEGCKLITHFYSCTSTITRESGFRKLGVIETGYLYDDITVEAIADGCHLPPELLKLIYKLKGEDRICLVTDAIRFAGMENTENLESDYGVPYIVEDGVAKLSDRSAFAGSIATADRLIYTCVKKAGIPLESAVKMMTKNPARVMGLKTKGSLDIGYDADIVLFDEDINIKKVIVGGREI